MKTHIASFLVTLLAWTGLPSVSFAKTSGNRAYVQSGPDGVFYARCIPKDNAGSSGTTDIYRVKGEGDERVDHYDWYAAHSLVLGWSPIAGKVAVMARQTETAASPDKQVELGFYLGGKLLKTLTTDDLVRLGAEVHTEPEGGVGKRAEFQMIGCEQIPNTNQYVFTIRITETKTVSFDILTGEVFQK